MQPRFGEQGCPATRETAFTLIELLVVIAVISILMGILSPVIRSIRRQAKLTHCLGTVGQIGHGVSLYTEDHRGYFPPWGIICYCDPRHQSMGDSWWLSTHYIVQEYLGRDAAEQIWQCPADDMSDGNGNAIADDSTNAYLKDRRKCGYLYNLGGGSELAKMYGYTDEGLAVRGVGPRTLSWVKAPSRKIAAFCWCAHNFCCYIDMGHYWHSDYPKVIAPMSFVDGHARTAEVSFGASETAAYRW